MNPYIEAAYYLHDGCCRYSCNAIELTNSDSSSLLDLYEYYFKPLGFEDNDAPVEWWNCPLWEESIDTRLNALCLMAAISEEP